MLLKVTRRGVWLPLRSIETIRWALIPACRLVTARPYLSVGAHRPCHYPEPSRSGDASFGRERIAQRLEGGILRDADHRIPVGDTAREQAVPGGTGGEKHGKQDSGCRKEPSLCGMAGGMGHRKGTLSLIRLQKYEKFAYLCAG